MAKRAPKGDKPYRPVSASLAKGLLANINQGDPAPGTPQEAIREAQPADDAPEPRREAEEPVARTHLAPVPDAPVRQEAPPQAELDQRPPGGGGDTLVPIARSSEVAPERQVATRTRPSRVAVTRPARHKQEMDKLTIEKRLLLTPSEEVELERLVHSIAAQTGARIKLSHLLRAAVICVQNAEDDLLHGFAQVDDLVRPPNGDRLAMVEFETRIAQILASALRKAPPIRLGSDSALSR